MAFGTIESSVASGEPLFLYEFSRTDPENDATVYWRYATGDRDITIVQAGQPEPVTYAATPISDDGISQSGTASDDDVVVTVPRSSGIFQEYNGTPPSDIIYLTIRAMHYGDTDAPIWWIGTITQVQGLDVITGQITCAVETASFERNGLRLGWERGCNHFLYDELCKVNPLNFSVQAATVTILSGNSFQITSLEDGFVIPPDGTLDGGYFQFFNGPIKERRMIETHVGNVITVFGFTDGMTNGMRVTCFFGCDRTCPTCLNRFNNLANYGGYPYMPGTSPFDGNPVF